MPYVAPRLTSLSALKTRSGELTIPSSGVVTWTHSLGAAPDSYGAYLICKTAGSNWAVGDVVNVTTYFRDTSNVGAVFANSTVVGFALTGNMNGPDRAGGGVIAFLDPDWKIVFWAIP